MIDPKRTTATFDSTVMAVVHNVSTIHEIKVRQWTSGIRLRLGEMVTWILRRWESLNLSGLNETYCSLSIALSSLVSFHIFAHVASIMWGQKGQKIWLALVSQPANLSTSLCFATWCLPIPDMKTCFGQLWLQKQYVQVIPDDMTAGAQLNTINNLVHGH